MNKKTNLLRIAFLMLMVALLNVQPAEAQSKKRLRELENKEQERQAEEAAAEREAQERHLSIQSKQTRKEMKRYKKMSKRVNNNRKESFVKRWFRRRGKH
jgi:Flp pilus assembly protein TadB